MEGAFQTTAGDTPLGAAASTTAPRGTIAPRNSIVLLGRGGDLTRECVQGSRWGGDLRRLRWEGDALGTLAITGAGAVPATLVVPLISGIPLLGWGWVLPGRG